MRGTRNHAYQFLEVVARVSDFDRRETKPPNHLLDSNEILLLFRFGVRVIIS